MTGAAPPPGAAPARGTPAWNQQRRQQATDFINANVPEGSRSIAMQHPVAFAGRAGAFGGNRLERLARFRSQENALGYGQPQQQLTDYESGQLQNPDVNLRHEESPTLGALSSYARTRLGVGLTPEEESVIRGRGLEAIGGSTNEATRLAGNRLQSAGIDPRSGIGMAQAGQIQRGRQQEQAGLERDITLADLARKGEIEQLASGVAGQEEAGRQYDIGATQRRQALTEGTLGELAGLQQRREEFAVPYVEGVRQANLSRAAWQRAARASEPSTLEQVGTIAHGLFSGLGGGK